ncbi:hypothetical protein AB1Y20_008610 [Prymnesium parvum]|uniref:Queuosine salvage protein n=1 Tax=Prymnesium parvum TaxID=97485 RepID=A0AB34ITV6_PRYPA
MIVLCADLVRIHHFICTPRVLALPERPSVAMPSAVYSPPDHSLARKQCLALARPTDNAENIANSSTMPHFDLDQTIFKTMTSPLKRKIATTRLNVIHHWKEEAVDKVNAAYATIKKPPAPDNGALFKFMAEECHFGIEHADGSFMDHLHFCHEYSLLHFNEVSPRILLLHSILGVGTNCFPMTIDKLPALRAMLSATEMAHVEAFPSILRLLIRGPLLDELEQIVADGQGIEKISFHRVIDNAPLSMSGEELWTHLNLHLIHALDFLPVVAWKVTKSCEGMFHMFSRLYPVVKHAGQLQARIDFDPSWERDPVPGTRTTDLAHFLLDHIPSWLILRAYRQQIEEYSAAIGHDLSYTITRMKI